MTDAPKEILTGKTEGYDRERKNEYSVMARNAASDTNPEKHETDEENCPRKKPQLFKIGQRVPIAPRHGASRGRNYIVGVALGMFTVCPAPQVRVRSLDAKID